MTRTVSGTVAGALATSHVPALMFIELDSTPGFVRLTNAAYPSSWNGYTWEAMSTAGCVLIASQV